jgi:hypothetical protein
MLYSIDKVLDRFARKAFDFAKLLKTGMASLSLAGFSKEFFVKNIFGRLQNGLRGLASFQKPSV